MRPQDIKLGDVLELKQARQLAYGLSSPYVLVAKLRSDPRYARVWIITSANECYRPQDFRRKIHKSAS